MPLQIERLTALKAVHEKGADFAKTVAHLDTTQKQLEAMFTNDKKTLEKVHRNSCFFDLFIAVLIVVTSAVDRYVCGECGQDRSQL